MPKLCYGGFKIVASVVLKQVINEYEKCIYDR